MNDSILSELYLLSYALVDEAVQRIMGCSRGALLAKLDIESAYWIIPVHPDDRPLLGMVWKGSLYVDTALPFGLHSAPKLFNALVNGLSWILTAKGTRELLHYLDNFLFIGTEYRGVQAGLRTGVIHLCQLGHPSGHTQSRGPNYLLIVFRNRAGHSGVAAPSSGQKN